MSSLGRRCAFIAFLVVLTGRLSLAQSPSIVDAIRSKSLFYETFNDKEWESRWSHSRDAKYNGRFITDAAKGWTDNGLKIPEKNKYYGLTALLDAPVEPIVASSPKPLPLVVQYEVKYDEGVTCGGSYLKLLTADPDLTPEGLVDSTPYSIMFGPDRCGGTSKIHLIVRHRNPVNGTITEKHLASPPSPETNDYTHVYTLRLFPDHKYEILVDGSLRSSGGLMEPTTLQPPLLPPLELPDLQDVKPADWVDVAQIPDPHAVKPSDWDDREMVEDDKATKPKGWLEHEPALINDPAARRPADWDEEEDGQWEPNQIPNPRCKVGCGPWARPLKRNPAWKGAWKPPLIDNPEYKGPWVQRTLPNPDYFAEEEPLRTGVGPIGGVALELWTIDSGYMFDNILITRDLEVAELAVNQLWKPRNEAERRVQVKPVEDAKELAKRKKKKAQKGSRYGIEQLRQLTEAFLDLFEDGAVLSPLAPYLGPFLDHLEDQPDSLILLVGLGPLLLLTAVLLLRGVGSGARKPSAVAAHTAGGEDVDAAGEGAGEGQVSPAADGTAEPVGAAEAREGDDTGDQEPAPGAEQVEETVEQAEAAGEEIEEEDELVASGPRRRTPRVA
ncbi:hypothetical protein VOLCADRAFT_77379 [Volvox carteri f. nagariensis]|uniref:Calnexin n=1 Tax=Volvox carteri f. nagariensis TaxID=3068 RepID=D8UED0_VOLCA|nr:uncharacterized protein VOLCADRAFT_77379 [Volvox carteri f. nagariensis]EFJ41946.1 hypothetical protein VOLCADRAFT_77379 [Volvox carteri f. nagariensis]|eukprot:XP_002956983.1 hypothetical protein VOLCADRAFT_77379 [Volvox carteri f. nagariensis]